MSETGVCVICAGIALVAMLGWSLWMVYHVMHTQPSSRHNPKSDSEVLLDNLKLTNKQVNTLYQYTIRVPGEKTPAGQRQQMSPQFLQMAHTAIVKRIKHRRPTWTTEMRDAVAWDIIRRIDWDNDALMHKSLEWITDTTLERMCPKK